MARRTLLITACATAALVLAANAAEPVKSSTNTGTRPTYVEPLQVSDLPPIRRSGTARSDLADCIAAVGQASLTLLAPKNFGTTSKASPQLYWFVSRDLPQGTAVDVKIENYDSREALFRNRSVTGTPAGVQTITLPPSVQLQPGQKYVALVALRCNAAEARAEDPVARAGILRSTDAAADTCGPDASCAFAAAAGRGSWYDAMESAFGPKANAETRATGIEWLRGAGLTEAADSLSK